MVSVVSGLVLILFSVRIVRGEFIGFILICLTDESTIMSGCLCL